MTLYSWSDLTVEKITNLFLYGTDTTPTNYEERLRTQVEYDALPLNDKGEKVLRIEVYAIIA